MKKLLIAGMFLCTATVALANDVTITGPQESNQPMPSASKVPLPQHPTPEVRAYLLMDYTSGRILFGEHYDERIDPASLTKMMTSYVIGQELRNGKIKPTDMVNISENAWSKKYSGSSKMFIEVGKQVSVDNLHKGIIIQSGNDACIAMAEHLAGSTESFASLMNEWASRIGMKSTHFVNPHGLYDDNHYSTAYDMAVLGRALIRDLPEEYEIYSQKEFTFNGIKQSNRNRLLWDESLHVDGIKTGHLSQVGYNLVASAVNPTNGMRLISVIIGDVSEKSRAENSRALLRYGFRFYEPYTPVKASQPLITKQVRLGNVEEIKLGVERDVSFAIPINAKENVKAAFTLNKDLVANDKSILAPIHKGQHVGTITFSLDGKAIYQLPLVALEDVGEASFFAKLWDRCVMTVSGWFE